MTDEAELAQAFIQAQPRLVRIAYAVLGSHAEAEDVVADCWLRLSAANAAEEIRDVDAWTTVAVARLALDALRSARIRRERYVGPWLPEPILAPMSARPVDPAEQVTLDDTVSFAVLVVLETLSPAERTAWVLHDVFGLSFAQIAEVVGRSVPAVRQLAARARKHVRAGTPRVDVSSAEHEAAFQAFVQAAGGGDFAGLLAVLDPEVTLTADGGGIVSAARRPVHGADAVARFLFGMAAKGGADGRMVAIRVNGQAGLALMLGDHLEAVLSLTVRNARVARVDLVRTPAKLSGLPWV
jgi:RNA polymerase sigma-70 factor (ECF subfamily)